MYLKTSKIYYKLNETLSLRLDSLVSTIEPVVPYSPIILEETSDYKIHISYASVFIHEHQLKLTIQEVIKSIFKDIASNINIHFEPRDILKISLYLGKMIPVHIEGSLAINKKSNTIVYQFNKIKVMGFPVISLLEAIKSLPGIALSFKSDDGKARLENDLGEVYPSEFIPEVNLIYELNDIYFTENGISIEVKGKQLHEIKNEFSFNLPDSYVYLLGDTIKINNIAISDTKIAIFKDDGTPFAISLNDYMNFIRKSTITYTEKDEIVVKVPVSEETVSHK